jgi:hypothetical protein
VSAAEARKSEGMAPSDGWASERRKGLW